MRNLETPTYKLLVYGGDSSLGSAILAEALHRQFEATAVLDDLNEQRARPGLRAKSGGLSDPIEVSRSVAGMHGVICLLEVALKDQDDFALRFNTLIALLDGLETAGVKRLMVVDDFTWLDRDLAPESPVHHLTDRLKASTVAWTLVQAPPSSDEDLGIDDFKQPGASALPLHRFAMAVLDELDLALHHHQRLQIDL